MPLTDAEKHAIREEEYFRAEVRKELAAGKGPPSVLERMSGFLETKAGFWLLTTVLAGAFATGMTALQQHLNRDEIIKREAADRARRDTETLIKLGPMLTSDNRSQIDVALVLLTGLASREAVESSIAAQVESLIKSTLAAGAQPNASTAERTQAAAIVAYADRASFAVVQGAAPGATPDKAAATAVASVIPDTALPVRVYVHIADEADRGAAKTVSDALRSAGIVAPGTELVPKSNIRQAEIRYCKGKVAPEAPQRVRDIVAAQLSDAQLVVLPEKLCGRVRANHFELWFARRA